MVGGIYSWTLVADTELNIFTVKSLRLMSTSTTLDKKHWNLLSAMHCFGLLDNYESSFCVPEGWSVLAVGGPFIYFFLHYTCFLQVLEHWIFFLNEWQIMSVLFRTEDIISNKEYWVVGSVPHSKIEQMVTYTKYSLVYPWAWLYWWALRSHTQFLWEVRMHKKYKKKFKRKLLLNNMIYFYTCF